MAPTVPLCLANPPAPHAPADVVAPEQIDAAVAQIANFVKGLGRSLAITVDDRSGNFVVQVQNAQTKEVIRQIPSEEVMRIAAAVEDRNDALRLMGERGAGGAASRRYCLNCSNSLPSFLFRLPILHFRIELIAELLYSLLRKRVD